MPFVHKKAGAVFEEADYLKDALAFIEYSKVQHL